MTIHKIIASLFSLAALVMTAACSPVKALNAVIPDSGYQLTEGIGYGALPRQKLDIYVPKKTATTASKPLPVVVFFYGGSWDSGERGNYKFVGEAMSSQGFIAVVPDYRVYPDVLFPAFMEDPARAVKWAKEHAAEFGGDPGRIFLAGHSAGAHIAAMLVLDDEFLAAQHLKPADVAGMVGLAGPYDFLPLTSEHLKTIFGPEEQRAKSQPINYVTGNNPPMLLLVGTKDNTVWPKNTYNLAAKIRAKGGPVEVKEFAGYSHIDMAAKLARPIRDQVMLSSITSFISRH